VLLKWPSFFAPMPLHMGKLVPVIILLECVVEASNPKKAEISCNRSQGELARPLCVKRPLSYRKRAQCLPYLKLE
jgi:hypothetical protein